MIKKIKQFVYLSVTSICLGVATLTPHLITKQDVVSSSSIDLANSTRDVTTVGKPTRAIPTLPEYLLPDGSKFKDYTPTDIVHTATGASDPTLINELQDLVKTQYIADNPAITDVVFNDPNFQKTTNPGEVLFTYLPNVTWAAPTITETITTPQTTSIKGFFSPGKTDVTLNSTLPAKTAMYAQDFANTTTYDNKLIEYIENKKNVPNVPGIDASKIFEILMPRRFDNQKGELSFQLRVHQYYDDTGVLNSDVPLTLPAPYYVEVNPTKHLDFPITITGFNKVPGKTSINLSASNEISSKLYDYKNVDPQSLDDDVLKQIICENIINFPANATYKNVIFNRLSTGNFREYDLEHGKVKLNITLNMFFDDRYNLVTTPSFPSVDVVITGFKEGIYSNSTTFPDTTTTFVNVAAVNDVIPYQYVGNTFVEFQMKTALKNSIQNLPSGFDVGNINITEYRCDNKHGRMIVSGDINFFIKNGEIIYPSKGETLPFREIKLAGFQSVAPTTIKSYSVELPSLDGLSPQELNDKSVLKNALFENSLSLFENLPSDFGSDNIIVAPDTLTIIQSNNLTGVLDIGNITINRYFEDDEYCTYIDGTSKNLGNLKITKLKITPPTDINASITVPSNYHDSYASDVYASDTTVKDIIKRLVFSGTGEVFLNLPPDFKDSNITEISLSSYNNREGQIGFEILVDYFYNSKGILIGPATKETKRFKAVLTGFKRVISILTPPAKVKLTGSYDNLLPQELNEDQLKEIISTNIMQFFNPIPKNFVLDRVEKLAFDNLAGTVTVKLTAFNYFDTKGSHKVVNTPISYQVVVSGFKQVLPTDIITDLSLSSPTIGAMAYPWKDEVAGDVAGDAKNLRNLMIDIKNSLMVNTPLNFNINNFEYFVNSFDNKKGTINLHIKLYYYYDKNGVLINDVAHSRPLEGDVIIQDFKKVTGTVILQRFSLKDIYNNTLPSLITEEMLTEILWSFRADYIEDLPKQILASDLYFNFREAYANNLEGSISVTINLTKYYDKNSGDLIITSIGSDVPPLSETITIEGFQKIPGATTVVQGFDVSKSYAEDSIPRASEVSAEDLVSMLLSCKDCITNKPQNFGSSNIQIVSSTIQVNNISGYLYATVQLNKYYDATGLLHDDISSWASFPVKFYGFKTQFPTVVSKMINLPEFYNKKASEFSNDEILSLIRQNYQNPRAPIIQNLPEYFSLENIVSFDFTATPNNKLGQVTGRLTINKYFNSEGALNKKGEFLETDVLLVGFEPVGQTYANNVITLNEFNDDLPTLVDTSRIIDAIRVNKSAIYTNLPSITNDNLKIQINSRSNKTGTVEARLILYKYFNSSGTLIDTLEDAKAFATNLTIKGFRKTLPTSAITQMNVVGFEHILPTDVNLLELNRYLWKEHTSILSSIPDGFNENDMKASIISTDNREGKLKINLSLSTYYDDASNLIKGSTNVKKFQITLLGFKAVSPTGINTNVTLNNIQLSMGGVEREVTLNDFENDNKNDILKQLVLKNQKYCFTNLVNDTLSADDISVSIVSNENKIGTIKAWVNLYKYYDENGNIVSSAGPIYLRKLVTFKGFTPLSPSEVSSYVSIAEIPTPTDPDEVVRLNNIISKEPSFFVNESISDKDKPNLRALLGFLSSQIFLNMPDDFEFNKDVVEFYAPTAENSYGNVDGELRVNLTYKNYYDENAVLQKTKTKTQTIVISGFKKIIATSVSRSIFVDNDKINTKFPQEVTSDELKDFLINKDPSNLKTIINFSPKDFNQAKDITGVNITSYDNQKGTINAVVFLSCYYDEKGMLVAPATASSDAIGQPKGFEVTFINFKKSIPTLVNYEEISGKDHVIDVPIGDKMIEPQKFQTMSPEDWNKNKNDLNVKVNNAIINYQSIPTTITINNYIPASYNNQDGSIRVTATIKNFINNKYELVDQQDITLKISGFAVSNTFVYNSVNDAFKYTMYILGGVMVIIILICLVGFIMTYRKKRGLK